MYEKDKMKKQAYALVARWCDLLELFEDRTNEAEPLTRQQQSIYLKLKRYYMHAELRYYRRSAAQVPRHSVITMTPSHAR